MKKYIVFGCILVVFVLTCASLPSVLSYQIIQNEGYKNFLDSARNHLQEPDVLRTVDSDVMNMLLEKIRQGTETTVWEPGLLLVLLFTLLSAAIEAISQGKWFPGMVFGVFILYLVLVWLIIFGQNVPTS